MKSLEFFKPTLATTLAIVMAWLLSVRPAQAGGYTVTLQQVGPDVVATGSGAIDLTGLTFYRSGSGDPQVIPYSVLGPYRAFIGINTGPTSSTVDIYYGAGLRSFGSGGLVSASSGSGDMVGIAAISVPLFREGLLTVPRGYVSGTALSDMAIYSGRTLASLGVTPGTYVSTWGTGANQNFTLQILPEVLPAANITNFSTRASVQTGQGVTIAGFVVGGTGSKSVVVRGLGSTLAQPPFNVQGVLADPTVQLFDSGGHPFWFNDNWKDTQQAQIQATGLAAPNDLESGILQFLEPGNYTAILSGKNGTTGVGLVELYDINPGASAELTNVSTRGFVGTGDNLLIAGFISNGSTEVLVRGLGPTLALPQFGVSGALADPVVTLVDGNGNVVQTNDNWKNTDQAAISATGKAPPNDLEAAILAPVSAGNYTAILSGNGLGTGIGLVEVYKLP